MTEKWKFSDIELASPGMRRQIAVYARPDDDPVLEILMTRDGAKAGRHLVHRRHIDPLARAVSIAQGGAITDADGRHSAGEITMRGGARVSFLVVLGRTPAVQLWLAAPDGRRLGRPTTISGAELVALGHAIDHLRSIGVGGTGPRGVSLASRGLAFGALQRSPVAAPTSRLGRLVVGAPETPPKPSTAPKPSVPAARRSVDAGEVITTPHGRVALSSAELAFCAEMAMKPLEYATNKAAASARAEARARRVTRRALAEFEAAAPSRLATTFTTPHGVVGVSARELRLCEEAGASPEDYAANKAATAAGFARQTRRSNAGIKR